MPRTPDKRPAFDAAAWDEAVARARALPAGRARGEALVELAERRAILQFAGAPVKQLLLDAAPELEGDPILEARCMLRLGAVALAEESFEVADGHLSRAADRFRAAEYFPGVFVATTQAARLLVRQDKRDEAKGLLDALAKDLLGLGESLGPRAAIGLSVALGEWTLDDEDAGPAEVHFQEALSAIDRAGIADDDARFAALGGLAALATLQGDGRRAGGFWRPALGIAQAYGSVEDVLQARLNLGLALVSTNEPGPRGDGHAQLQIVVDEARERGLDKFRLPALMGLVGVYSNKGATEGALDRVLEIARSAVDQGKPELYAQAVALMGEVYARKGDFTQAFLALLKGRAALKLTVSEEAAKLVDPHIDALAERMGQAKFDAMCERVVAAQEARKRLEREGRRDKSR